MGQVVTVVLEDPVRDMRRMVVGNALMVAVVLGNLDDIGISLGLAPLNDLLGPSGPRTSGWHEPDATLADVAVLLGHLGANPGILECLEPAFEDLEEATIADLESLQQILLEARDAPTRFYLAID